MINSQNELREMLASGVVSPEDVQRLAMQAPGDPQENSRLVQNALAEVFSSQLPTGSMRNQSTGKMTYFRPSPGPGPGFSNTPYTQEQAAYGGGSPSMPQAPQVQRRGIKVYGVGGGQIIELGEDEEKTLPVDYTRAPITIPGVGKAHYTADGRFAVGMGSDGQPFKAILGYDAVRSAERNAQALAQERARAEIAQTNQQIAASQQQVAASQQSAGLAQAAEARAAEEHAAKMARRDGLQGAGIPQKLIDEQWGKAEPGYRRNADGSQTLELGGPTEDAMRAALDAAEAQLRNVDEMVGKRGPDGKLLPNSKPHPGFDSAVGFSFGKALGGGYIPGSKIADFNSRHAQIEGGAFMQAYKGLKGGGQITEIEGKKATAAITRANTAQSQEEYVSAVMELRQMMADQIARTQQKLGIPQIKGPRPKPNALAVSEAKRDPAKAKDFIEFFGPEEAARYGIR